MNVINYTAVVLAAVANMGLGFLWFGPIFGKKWVRTGCNKDMVDAQKVKGEAGKGYVIACLATLGSLVMSSLLAYSLVLSESYLKLSRISTGLVVGFWIWLGFIVPIALGRILWDGKPWMLLNSNAWKHLFIINGYYLVSLLLMGWILASF